MLFSSFELLAATHGDPSWFAVIRSDSVWQHKSVSLFKTSLTGYNKRDLNYNYKFSIAIKFLFLVRLITTELQSTSFQVTFKTRSTGWISIKVSTIYLTLFPLINDRLLIRLFHLLTLIKFDLIKFYLNHLLIIYWWFHTDDEVVSTKVLNHNGWVQSLIQLSTSKDLFD